MNKRELQKLSAYMDQELSPRENQKLELRLQAEPALRAALQELRETKKIIARMRRVAPPHNFTLTRAMVGEIKSRSFYPFFRVASVLATVAFAVLVGADAFLLAQSGESSLAAQSAVTQGQEIEAQVFDEAQEGELKIEADAVAEQPADQAVGEVEDRAFPTATGLQTLESAPGFGVSSEPMPPTLIPCRDCSTESERAVVRPTGTAADAQRTAQPTERPSALPPAVDLEQAEATPLASEQLPTPTVFSRTINAPEKPLRIAELATGFAALFLAAIALILRRAL